VSQLSPRFRLMNSISNAAAWVSNVEYFGDEWKSFLLVKKHADGRLQSRVHPFRVRDGGGGTETVLGHINPENCGRSTIYTVVLGRPGSANLNPLDPKVTWSRL